MALTMTNKQTLITVVRLILVLVVLMGTVYAQQANVTVSGKVTDDLNNAISGVSIYSKNAGRVLSASDDDGSFSVSTSLKDELTFQFMGFESTKFTVSRTQSGVVIVMSETTNMMEETVVVGYQTRTRETMTGSSVIISGKDLQDVPVANVMELLQGRVAGLNIQNNTGTPGRMGSVNIRGISSVGVSGTGNDAFLTPTTPLFVIDGVPVDNESDYQYGFEQTGPGLSPLSLIPVEDIEQIEVLKDAQATSLYGSRGAYGVILVTTKRGNSKVPIVQYTSNFFISNPPALRDILGGRGERLLRIQQLLAYDTSYNHALELVNSTPFLSDSLNPYYNNSTNWQSYFYRTTSNHTHNVNISGGDELFNYKVNTGYYDEKGIVKNTGYKRYNMNMNMQYQPNRRFKLSSYINAAIGNNSAGSGNALRQTGVASGAAASSLLPAPSIYSASSDLLSAYMVDNQNKTTNVSSNLEVQYEPFQDFRASTTFSYTHNNGDQYTFKPAMLNENVNEIYSYNDRRNTVYNRSMLSYVKSYDDLHTFNVYAFSELNMTSFRADGMLIEGTPHDAIQGPLGQNNSLGGTFDNIDDLRSVAFAGSFSYNFDRKYVLDMSYRYDGSSTNGVENPYTQNPSIGARWNFNKEQFMESLHWLSYGSLRLSWGKNIVPTGNIYDVYGRYIGNTRTYNNNPNVSLDLDRIPNTALVPMTTTQLSSGLDIGFLNGKYNVTMEAYYKQVDGELRLKEIANHNAFGGIRTNETSFVNYGYEVSLNARPLAASSPFKWTVNINGALNRDVMALLPDGVRQLLAEDDSELRQAILYRLGINSLSNILYYNGGVYPTDLHVPVDPLTGLPYRFGSAKVDGAYFRAGDPILIDLNGDYILDENDYVIAGNSQPSLTGGFSSYLTYKNYSLNVACSYTLYRDILNNALANTLQSFRNPTAQNAYVPLDAYNFWQQDGDQAVYPNPYNYLRYTYFNPNMYDQTLFQEDGSYFKINSATFGYNFDREKLQRYGMTSLRVYATANNVYTFSKYSGPDPELVTALGRDDSGGYPRSRSYAIGVQVQF